MEKKVVNQTKPKFEGETRGSSVRKDAQENLSMIRLHGPTPTPVGP